MLRSTILVLCVLVLSNCARPGKTEERGDPVKAVRVAVARAVRVDLSRQWSVAAEFRPYQEVELHAKVAGYLKEIFVDVGARVKKGQVVATLEIPELTEDLGRAVAATRRSEAELLRARGELERVESAHGMSHLSYSRLSSVIKARPNLVAQQEIDEASARDHVSEAQVSATKAALAASEQQVAEAKANEQRVKALIEYSRITVPFDGVITKRYADTGAMIQAGTASQTQTMPVVRVSQNSRLRLVLPVPESIVPRIRVGAPVEVRATALGRNFRGTVSRFTEKVQASTRTMDTEVDVPNPQLVLIPGMYAEAVLTLDRHDGTLAVPVQAVSRGEKTTVLVVNKVNSVEERAVTVGIETPDQVEILSGLQENELVVIGSRGQIKPGQLVDPKIMESATAKRE